MNDIETPAYDVLSSVTHLDERHYCKAQKLNVFENII